MQTGTLVSVDTLQIDYHHKNYGFARPTSWRGINTCVIEDNTSLTAFNYMVIKYKWGNGAGADLDTFTGIVNTGVAALDNKFVGYGAAQTSQVPSGSSISTSYVFWAGDDTNAVSGSESVLINFSKVTTASFIYDKY
jgi:hypothetical protein